MDLRRKISRSEDNVDGDYISYPFGRVTSRKSSLHNDCEMALQKNGGARRVYNDQKD